METTRVGLLHSRALWILATRVCYHTMLEAGSGGRRGEMERVSSNHMLKDILELFVKPVLTEVVNAWRYRHQFSYATRLMHTGIPDKIVIGAHIFEELAYKYRYRAQEIISFLCGYLQENIPWHHEGDQRTAEHFVAILRMITALPRTDANGHPLLIDLNRLKVVRATLRNINFHRVILWGSDFVDCRLEWCNFAEADLGGCRFERSSMEFTNLSHAKMWPSVYEHPKRETSFNRAKLAGATLDGAIVYGADFHAAIDIRREDWEKTIRNETTKEPVNLH